MLKNNLLLQDHHLLLDKVIEFYLSKEVNPNLFEDIKAKCSNHNILSKKLNHDSFLKLGYFGQDDFIIYTSETKSMDQNIPISMEIINIILSLLSQNKILIKSPVGTIYNSYDIYRANGNLAKKVYENNLIKNIIIGFNYIYDKYKNSVLKIEISKNDYKHLGTGFLLKTNTDEKRFVVTNKHVIDKADSIAIISHNNRELEILDIERDISNDIAILVINFPDQEEGFLPNLELNILDEIITIGYPIIPTSRDAYLVCHSGEINSLIKNYQGNELFVFSSKIAPGSSGSPIVDNTGRFVGLVTERLFEKDTFKEKGITPYSAGIPAKKVIEFLNQILK